MHIAMILMLTCSWYGADFHGNTTANGEIYDMHAMTAASTDLPFDTVVRLWRDDPRESVYVRINDRGPYEPEAVAAGVLEPHRSRDLDLSRGAFGELADLSEGVITVNAEIYEPGEAVPPLEIPPEGLDVSNTVALD